MVILYIVLIKNLCRTDYPSDFSRIFRKLSIQKKSGQNYVDKSKDFQGLLWDKPLFLRYFFGKLGFRGPQGILRGPRGSEE